LRRSSLSSRGNGRVAGEIVGGSMFTPLVQEVPDAITSLPLVETLAHWGSVLLTSLYF